MLVDALGNVVRFVLLPGQSHDINSFDALMAGIRCLALIGDKAFDAHWLRANLNDRGAAAVIPSKADRAGRIPHDTEMYKWRHLVENFFCSLKASDVSRPATKRPMHASPASSISSPRSSRSGDCKQALVAPAMLKRSGCGSTPTSLLAASGLWQLPGVKRHRSVGRFGRRIFSTGYERHFNTSRQGLARLCRHKPPSRPGIYPQASTLLRQFQTQWAAHRKPAWF